MHHATHHFSDVEGQGAEITLLSLLGGVGGTVDPVVKNLLCTVQVWYQRAHPPFSDNFRFYVIPTSVCVGYECLSSVPLSPSLHFQFLKYFIHFLVVNDHLSLSWP